MAYSVRSTVDPDGRRVVFDAGSQLHMALTHPWVLDHLETVLATVANPDWREHDVRPGRERFFRRHVMDPSRWLRVVVDFGERPAWIVTAFVQDHDPRRVPR